MGLDMFIPERLVERVFDAVADVLASKIEKMPGGEKIARQIKALHSKAASRGEFQDALNAGIARFIDEYRVVDEDLVAAIRDKEDFLEDSAVQEAFVNILKRPDRVLDSDQQLVQKYFDNIFPERINRDRVNNAVSFFLRCLAESVWLLPEFGAIYSLLFQRSTAENVRKQTLMEEARLGLTAEIRDILLELTEITRSQAQLQAPEPSTPILPLGPEGSSDGTSTLPRGPRIDWGNAFFESTRFYGRQKERDQLCDMVLKDRAKVVGVFGLGGVGKSAISVKLVNQIGVEFDYIFGISLLNPRPLAAVLVECIQFLSNQRDINLPTTVEKLMPRLISYMRQSRCLLVIDNFEGILKEGQVGHFRDGFDDYGNFLTLVGETDHKSCVLITSRAVPEEFALLEGDAESPVRALHLAGLSTQEGKQILQSKGLRGTDDQVKELVEIYSGNPLALLIVSEMIRTVYVGQIGEFLKEVKEEGRIFGGIKSLLDESFQSSSGLEQKLMYWLAVEREPIPRDQLFANFLHGIRKPDLMMALRSLIQRSLVEQDPAGSYVKLQNLVMEYVTASYIERICQEIQDSALELFVSHAMTKAQSKSYIREMQETLILKPIVDSLSDALQKKEAIAEKLQGILSGLKNKPASESGYAAGNTLNILVYLGCDFTNMDFSHLVVRQAYLQGVELHGVNFSYADLGTSVFAETFAGVLCVKVSRDGSHLAAGSIDGNVYVWDLPDGRLRRVLSGHSDWVRAISFSHDSKRLASCSYDQSIRLWDVETGACLDVLTGHSTWVTGVDFHKDDQLLASSSLDGTIRLWDISAKKCLRTLVGHEGGVQALEFSPDGLQLASGGSDGTVRLWDMLSGNCEKTFNGHLSQVWSVRFSPNGLDIASGSHDKTVRIWTIDSGECRVLNGHTNWVMSVAYNSDGTKLVSSSADQTGRVWDAQTGEYLRPLTDHANWVWGVDVNPLDGTMVSGSSDQTVRFWDSLTGKCFKVLQGYDMAIKSVAFNPSGELLASAGNDRVVRLWDIEASRCTRALRGHTRQVWSVAFSPSKRIMASGGEDQVVRIWDLDTGECVKSLEGHTSWIYVAFSRDGRLLASSGTDDEQIRIWNTSTWKLERLIKSGSRVWTVDFSGDGRRLASAHYDKKVRIWEVATGDLFRELDGHTDQVWCVDFSPDDSLLASAGEDKTIKVWETNDWTPRLSLTGHGSWILTAIFDPEGKLIASEGPEDNTIRIWRVADGAPLQIIQSYKPWSLAFDPRGRYIASGSYDGKVRLWDMQDGKLRKTLAPPRLYEGTNITGVLGLTDMQKATLVALGAVSSG